MLLSLSSLLAASPAVAAAATADAVSSAPTISYAASSPVAPEAVDSAVTQIIEAVKVRTILLQQLTACSTPHIGKSTPAYKGDSCETIAPALVQAAGGAVKSGLGVAAKGAGYVKEVRHSYCKAAALLCKHSKFYRAIWQC